MGRSTRYIESAERLPQRHQLVGVLVLRPQHHSPAAECSPDSVRQGESVGLEARVETESAGRLDISQAFLLSSLCLLVSGNLPFLTGLIAALLLKGRWRKNTLV